MASRKISGFDKSTFKFMKDDTHTALQVAINALRVLHSAFVISDNDFSAKNVMKELKKIYKLAPSFNPDKKD